MMIMLILSTIANVYVIGQTSYYTAGQPATNTVVPCVSPAFEKIYLELEDLRDTILKKNNASTVDIIDSITGYDSLGLVKKCEQKYHAAAQKASTPLEYTVLLMNAGWGYTPKAEFEIQKKFFIPAQKTIKKIKLKFEFAQPEKGVKTSELLTMVIKTKKKIKNMDFNELLMATSCFQAFGKTINLSKETKIRFEECVQRLKFLAETSNCDYQKNLAENF
jgi:hypothetical protein